MSEVASTFVTVAPSAKGFGRTLDNQIGPELDNSGKSAGGRFSGALGGFLKKSVLGIGVAAGGILGTALFKGFNRLSAIDQAQAKLAGLGNSAAAVNKIMDNALASVKGTAFGLDEAATTAASAVAAGIKPGKDLEAVLKTVADTATIAGASMADTGAIFGSVAARGKLQGDDLMQLQSRGVPVLAFLAKHYGITAAAASQMVSKGQVDFKNFAAAMHEGLGGAALKSGDTFKGALANVNAALGRLGAGLLAGLFPIAKKVLGGLTVLLDDVNAKVSPLAAALSAKLPGAIAAIQAALDPLATTVKGFFDSFSSGGGGSGVSALSSLATSLQASLAPIGPVLVQIGQSIATNFLPVVQQLGVFISGTLLPGLSVLGAYLAANLVPVFVQVGQIISTQVVPIVASLASFLVGTLLPAIAQIVAQVATSLKPVFDQLVASFQSQVLPALQQLLAKFQQYQPTIQKVIGVLVLIIGKVLEFAAAILGRVLPPVIRFQLFLVGTLIGAVAKVISILASVISTVIRVGSVFVGAIASVARFTSGVISKVSEAVKYVGGIPGKVKGALGDLGHLLYDAGTKLIGGLIDGIKSKISALKNTVGSIAGSIAGFFHGSPVKEGPLKDHGWNSNQPGIRLVQSLIDGINSIAPKAKMSVSALASFMVKGFEDGIEGTKAQAASAFSRLTTLASATHVAGIVKLVAAAKVALKPLATAYESITAKIAATTDKLKQLQSDAAALAASVAQSVISTGDVSSVTGVDDVPVTFQAIIDKLTQADTQAQSFASTMAALKSAGLDQTTISQLIAAGPASLAAANAILQSGQTGIAQINALQASIAKSAAGLGKTAADSLYASGIAAAKGLVAGLKSQEKALVAQMEHMGKIMAAALKKALDSHSPSRVMHAIGSDAGAGLTKGVDSTRKDVAAASARLATSLTAPQKMSIDASTIGTVGAGQIDPAALGQAMREAIHGAAFTIDDNGVLANQTAGHIRTRSDRMVGR